MTYKHLPDGTIVEVLPHGGSRRVETRTDWGRLAGLTELEIEQMAKADPDHPSLDDAFWADAESQVPAVIRLAPDVAAHLRGDDTNVQERVNAILRDHFRSKRAAS